MARSASRKSKRAARPRRSAFNPATKSCESAHKPSSRPIDLERAFLDRATGEPVPVEVRRGGQTLTLDLALADSPARRRRRASRRSTGDDARVWDVFGLNLSEEPHTTFERRSTRYRGGMHVNSVRPNSPAAQEGIHARRHPGRHAQVGNRLGPGHSIHRLRGPISTKWAS